jgi:hypothetical protein
MENTFGPVKEELVEDEEKILFVAPVLSDQVSR